GASMLSAAPKRGSDARHTPLATPGYWLRLCFGNPPGRSLPTSREDRHRIVCSIRLPLPPIPRIRELRADDDGARMRGSGRAPSLEPAQGGGLNARLFEEPGERPCRIATRLGRLRGVVASRHRCPSRSTAPLRLRFRAEAPVA